MDQTNHPLVERSAARSFRPFATLLVASLASATAFAQQAPGRNPLRHNDGVQEATPLRGGPGGVPSAVYQRFPEEQCCGRTCLTCIEVILQDENPSTPDNCYIEVRAGIGSGPTGQPDLTVGGLVATYPIIMLPGPPIPTIRVHTVDPPCLALPSGDFYVGVRFNPQPLWPALDGMACMRSANEAQRALIPFPRYELAANQVGLAWRWDPVASSLTNSNDSWAIGIAFDEDTCQAFGKNIPRGVGLQNFGYAGIYPDTTHPSEGIGWQLRSEAPPGSPCVLFIGPPYGFGPVITPFGQLCIEPWIVVNGLTVAPSSPFCPSRSEFTWGAYGCFSITGVFGAQCATLDSTFSTIELSTACVTDF